MSLSREQANKANPLIDSGSSLETIANVSEVIALLEDLSVGTGNVELTGPGTSGFIYLAGCLRAALDFEIKAKVAK